MVSATERKVIRPTSNVERWQAALHLLSAYLGTTVACQYRLPASFANAESRDEPVLHFEHALARTVIHHPFLRVGLAEQESKTPYWVELDEGVDLSRHVSWLDATKRHDEYEALHRATVQEFLDTKFLDSETIPGWKVLVLRANETELDVIFGWNYTHCDGMSGKIFHRTLLRYLNDHAKAPKDFPYDQHTKVLAMTATAADLPPPQENISSYTLSFAFMVYTIWREIAYPWITGDKSHTAAWAPLRTTPYETHRATATLPEAPLARVLDRCRERGTTLTGLLHGIALVFFAKLLGPDQAKAFTSQTPLDQRRHTPPNSSKFTDLVPQDTMANYVSIVMHRFPAQTLDEIRALSSGSGPGSQAVEDLERIIWSAAADTRSDIQSQLDKGTKDDFTGLMSLIPDLRSYFRGELEKPRLATWLVSNLGVLHGGQQNEGAVSEAWSIRQRVVSLSSYVQGPACKLCVLSVAGSDLAVDVTWQAGVIDDETGQMLASDIGAWLQRFGSC